MMILAVTHKTLHWSFAWPLIPGLVGFAIAFVAQVQLRNHIDKEKLRELDDPSILYRTGLPPRQILTERGQKVYRLVHIGGGIFIARILLTMLLSALR
jgi:hypothetical protein